MLPQISVIMPVYNVKEFLKEAIDSIIVQKEFIHEIIIVDDGSTDGSGELIDRLYGGVGFVKIIHKANEGQGIARNAGTDHSSGNFIYYFDSDDISIQGLFEKFCAIVSAQPELELFCFSGESFLDKNYPMEKVAVPKLLSEKSYKRNIDQCCNSGEEAYILLNSSKAFYPGPPLYIFKKSILDKEGIKFRAIRYEDEEFTIKLFLKAGLTVISNEIYFKRRIRQGSTMQLNRSFKDILGYLRTIESLSDLKRNKDLKDDTIKLLTNKILHLVRAVIIMKARSRLRFKQEEKKVFREILNPFLYGNKELFVFYYKYPIEYRLRKLKDRISKLTKLSGAI